MPIVFKKNNHTSKESYRCIHKTCYNAHTNNLFRTSGILKLNELYTLEVAKVMFNYTNCNLPDPIVNLFISNLIVHQHNTRQRCLPHVTEHRTLTGARSITHAGPRIWSELPQAVKSGVNEHAFIKMAKKHFIASYAI